MEQKKNRPWMRALLILLVIVLLAAILWFTVGNRLVSKLLLTSALSRTFSQLETRFADDPLWILSSAYNQEGQYSADVAMTAQSALLGEVTYDMAVQANGSAHQIYAEGTAAAADTALNLSVYLDGDFMAVSSQELLEGTYYGITYNSFSEDLRQIPLLSLLISDSRLAQWAESVQSIQELMLHSDPLPDVSELSGTELRDLLLAIAALPCKVEKDSVSIDGETVSCRRLDFSVDGQQVETVLSELTQGRFGGEATVTASFYMAQRSVVQILLTCEEGADTVQYSLYLGLNPEEDRLVFQAKDQENGLDETFSLAVTTQRSDSSYSETWEIENANREAYSYSFDWAPASGEMTLHSSASSEAAALTLTETEDGFQLKTEDLRQLLRVLSREEPTEASEIACVMTVRQGAQIATPSYKNLDEWSLEDFLTLLSGIGSLIGLQLENT